MKEFNIFCFAATGNGISGGDRIFIELARRISKSKKVILHLAHDGFEMCKRQNLKGEYLEYKVSDLSKYEKLGFHLYYIVKIVFSVIYSLKLNISNSKNIVCYSASEFWMDALPAFIVKLRKAKTHWVAAWYQTAPPPWKGFSEQVAPRYRLRALPYWLSQLAIKPLISSFSDSVCVNNKIESRQFSKHSLNQTFVMHGAVDIDIIKIYKQRYVKEKKIYAAVFQGRFHPQKGVVELIDIWRLVTGQMPDARLAMIGDGPLMPDVQARIEKYKLSKNIKLFGYLFDGPRKYKTFSQSKLVVHPSLYDSGGMAAAEAVAFGLGIVGYDLESYKDYYKKGILKVKVGNKEAFSDAILKLLKNKKKLSKLARDAQEDVYTNWSWDVRARDFSNFIGSQK